MKAFCIVALAVSVCFVSAGNTGESGFDPVPEKLQMGLSKLFKKHMDLSMNYLYTSTGYGNQRVQKSGMSKHLLGLSDSHWHEGIDTLKKFFKRGGHASSVYGLDTFKVKGKNDLDISAVTSDTRTSYVTTLEKLVTESEECVSILNELHKFSVGGQIQNFALVDEIHDADWGHYFEEKLESEEERRRELSGHVTNFKQMTGSTLAYTIFDQSL